MPDWAHRTRAFNALARIESLDVLLGYVLLKLAQLAAL
jgi:hypothetical protein